MILHDNAYSDIVYDGVQGSSFLSVPGAMEVGWNSTPFPKPTT